MLSIRAFGRRVHTLSVNNKGLVMKELRSREQSETVCRVHLDENLLSFI